jgi:dienelactone hydrolase
VKTNVSEIDSEPLEVTFDSPDGVVLVGSFYGSPSAKSPAVILLHQWQSDRHSYDDFAKQLQADGFNVLSFDGRGFGESVKTKDGKAVPVSRTDDAVKGMLGDVGAAYEFLKKQPNVDAERIGIVGASYGSSLALIYAADHQEIKIVALLSPGLNYFGNMPTEPAIKKFGDRPLLLVAAEDDAESAKSVRALKAAGSDATEIKIYEKGGHGTGIFSAKVGLEETLETFLTENLAK